MYIWDVHNNTVSNAQSITTNMSGKSIPLIADIDNDKELEILIQCAASDGNRSRCYKYNASTRTFTYLWGFAPDEDSYSTTATLFDFNQDGKNEVLLADQSRVRILNGSGKSHITGADTVAVYTMAAMVFGYGTCMQYPIIADVDDDGSAELIAIGTPGAAGASTQDGSLNLFKSSTAQPWAPARKVWNQYMYNAVHVNEDLTVPSAQLSPATAFPGKDGLNGTADDVRPFNNFLQQQTFLNTNGNPYFLLPDVLTTPTIVSSLVFGDSVSIKIGLINRGDAAIGSPIYVSLYKESIPQTFASPFFTDSAYIVIMPGDTDYVFVRIPDVTLFQPLGNIVVRLNDNGSLFPFQAECDTLNNTLTILNPAYHQLAKKSATLFLLPSSAQIAHNGAYSNPVATLHGEEIEYRISAVNAFAAAQTIEIRDTLPAYLHYLSGKSNISPVTDPPPTVGTPLREALYWSVVNVSSTDSAVVTFRATPQAGVCASQPMYINQAWVTVGGARVPTNSTYHQGAGITLVTFSAGFGGHIYNAVEQALDYGASPHSGVVVVPDEGYRFAGWSHTDYPSLRGETCRAQSGILLYETLIVFGDVSLNADFKPESYPIVYHLYGGENAGLNPATYTIETESVTLGMPEKAGDIFIGWTGSNGDEPQLLVTIPQGSTGERIYHANYLNSIPRKFIDVEPEKDETDRIWAAEDMLYVKTSKPGSIVRIYSPEGFLQRLQTILHRGETTIKLPGGLYIVTLNNGLGKKIMIND
jgi:uncharacterized repeat protein (TIGR02543 family)